MRGAIFKKMLTVWMLRLFEFIEGVPFLYEMRYDFCLYRSRRERMMAVEYYVIIGFAAAMAAVAVLFRHSTLDKLPFLPGEEVLFEEDGVRVEQAHPRRTVVFLRCLVRVTNYRIITAQHALLSKKKPLRHVAAYRGPAGEGVDLPKTLGKGFVVVSLNKDRIRLETRNEKPVVVIPLDGSILTEGQSAVIYTKNMDAFRDLLKG